MDVTTLAKTKGCGWRIEFRQGREDQAGPIYGREWVHCRQSFLSSILGASLEPPVHMNIYIFRIPNTYGIKNKQLPKHDNLLTASQQKNHSTAEQKWTKGQT